MQFKCINNEYCFDALYQLGHGFEKLMSNAISKKYHAVCSLHRLCIYQRTRTNHRYVKNMKFLLGEGEITFDKMQLVLNTIDRLKHASIKPTPGVNDGRDFDVINRNLQRKEILIKLITTTVVKDDERRIALRILDFIVIDIGMDDDIINKIRSI